MIKRIIGYQATKKLKRMSVYTMKNRHLLLSGLLDIESFNNLKDASVKAKKEGLSYWTTKLKQSLNLEKSRVIIDNNEYLITPLDGFLAKLPEMPD